VIEINRLDTRDAGFDAALGRLLDRAPEQDGAVLAAVEKIVADVRARGDDAVLELTNRFDRRSAASIAELEIGKDRLRQGWEALPADLRAHH